MWDLYTKSSLLRSCRAESRTVILRPFRTVSAYLLPVTSVAFCHRVPFMLASCSMDRSATDLSVILQTFSLFCVMCALVMLLIKATDLLAYYILSITITWYVIWNDNFYVMYGLLHRVIAYRT